jgi:hypothetical protein
MKVYTVLTIASNTEQGNALDVSKTAHTTREAAIKGLENYTEVQPNLFERTDETDGITYTVLVVEQEVV